MDLDNAKANARTTHGERPDTVVTWRSYRITADPKADQGWVDCILPS
jgi:hypothetical protein